MISWKERKPKFKRLSEFGGNTEKQYVYLINDWIPSQVDSDQLMRLFIGLRFNPIAFLCVVVWQRNWIDRFVKFSNREGKE